MKTQWHLVIFALLAPWSLTAGTVVVTTIPDELHVIDPLTTFGGVPLALGAEIRVGAFPGMSDDQILDLAAQGGMDQVMASFVSFGNPCAIGQGAEGAAGGFEIAVKDSATTAAWAGATVSLLIRNSDGTEFLVARFPGKTFEVATETGLEPLLSLHLADAKIVVGRRDSAQKLATSIAPSVGSFSTWLAGYPTITDTAMKLPGADADSDGRSNFLEYATGGDPASPLDQAPCWIQQDGADGFWIRFRHVPGLGLVRYTLESSAGLGAAWSATGGLIEPDPENPGSMRLRVSPPFAPSGFYRLNVSATP